MNQEFIEALGAIEKERGIKKEVLLDAIETALISAYKRNYGTNTTAQNVRVEIDRQQGDVHVYSVRVVADPVEDPAMQISLEDARQIHRAYEVGDIVESEVTPRSFGRIAAQTRKQMVVQRIREAERGIIYDQFSEKENEVLTAIVQRVEKRNVYVELGRTEGYLPATEYTQNEEYHVNDRIKVYVEEVRRSNKGPQVIVSRINPGLVKRLFEMEVPEIQTGVVQIKSIAREAGYRTKMAVATTDDPIDPVGACVGPKGIRVEKVVEELKGEKVDIIRWNLDPAEYVANALSPAKVLGVQINEAERAARVIVPDNQLSLAIGKEGQNARLAAKLTGWKIDIKSQSTAEELFEQEQALEQPFSEDEEA